MSEQETRHLRKHDVGENHQIKGDVNRFGRSLISFWGTFQAIQSAETVSLRLTDNFDY